MPPLRKEEYEALKKSIERKGVLVPIEIDEETGEVLDGHHRQEIATALGIEVPHQMRTFSTQAERTEHALILNLIRRHCDPITWAEAFERLLEVRGVDRGRGARNDKSETSATVAEVAKEIGVSERTARRRLAIHEEVRDDPITKEKVRNGDFESLTQKRVERIGRDKKAAARAAEETYLSEYVVGEAQIKHIDFRNLTVPEASVPLIFTDPPYPGEYLHLWKDLGKWAADALKPGGVLVAYSGQWHLLQVMSSLSEHLDYLWLGSQALPGPSNNLHTIQVTNRWKPILFFGRREEKPTLSWISDLVQSERYEKCTHEWQQSVGPAKYYIERLTKPGDLVVDPFVGGGSFAIAAIEARRSFLGCEINEDSYKRATLRIKEWEESRRLLAELLKED